MLVSTICGGLRENSNVWRRISNGMLSWNLLIMFTINVGSEIHFQGGFSIVNENIPHIITTIFDIKAVQYVHCVLFLIDQG